MSQQTVIKNSKTKWRDKAKALEQENETLSNMYEQILMQYTEAYEASNKYKKLATKYENLYLNLQSNSKTDPIQQLLEKQNKNYFLEKKNKKIDIFLHQNNTTNYKTKYDELHQKYLKLERENKSLQSLISKLQKENNEYIITIKQIKNDLCLAQRDILEMTNIVGVKQTLPTVQETMSQFHDIRDQQHHNTCTKLKKYIKSKGTKYQKYYINQIVHEVMFKSLIECYGTVNQFKKDIFDHIAKELNMDYTLKKIYYSSNTKNNIYDTEDEDDKEDQEFIDNEKIKILGNRLGSYFRENYQYILKRKELKENVINQVLSGNELKHFNDLRESDSDIISCYEEYIVQCIDICWIMLLQDPNLTILPLKWRPDGMKRYDDRINKRVLGSDRKSQCILYYVWPNLMRNDMILKNQKMEVVTKNQLYTPTKSKK